jgi:hypothetical protein
MKTEMMCEHANESPSMCPCPSDCYCRAHHCAGRALPTPHHQSKLVVGDYKLAELVTLGRDIWGNYRYRLDEIVPRLMVGVGDLARLVRSGEPRYPAQRSEYADEVKKELGNIIFSTIRWCDDLGFDVAECLVLAIEAQRKFAASGKPR